MGEPQYFPLEGDSPQIYFFPHCTNKKPAERTLSSFSRIIFLIETFLSHKPNRCTVHFRNVNTFF